MKQWWAIILVVVIQSNYKILQKLEVWDRDTHTHTHTHIHAHTHIYIHTIMHIKFPDKSNVKKNQVCTGWVKLIWKCQHTQKVWTKLLSCSKEVLLATVNKLTTLYVFTSTNSSFFKKEVKSKPKHPRCKKGVAKS